MKKLDRNKLMKIKIIEFIEYVNINKYIPSQVKFISTENINNVGVFWNANKNKIYDYINIGRVRNKYPIAYEIIDKKYNRFSSIETFDDDINIKIIEFIEYVNINNTIPKVFSKNANTKNINNVGIFWQNNMEKIYIVASKKENIIKYPVAYNIIIIEYKKTIIKYLASVNKWDKSKTTKNIKYICSINNIDYESNKSILTHISYKELVAKINFLNKYNIPICNNGMLNEIFTMSSSNILYKYNIDLEYLIYNYFTIQSKII